MGNAVKYGKAGAPIDVRLTGDGARVSCRIVNQGAPIPGPLIDRMFEPLTCGPQEAEDPGTREGSLGLGLYIAREIVRAHGGSISAHSDAGGTVFSVELPR